MSAYKLLIAEKDLEYGRALSRAVSNLHNEFEITIVDLGALGKAKSFGRIAYQEYDLILIGGCPDGTAEKISSKISNCSKVVILTDYSVENLLKQSENNENHYWYLYKYENINNLVADLNYLIAFITGKKSLMRKTFTPELICFYSVSGGAGKTVIALGTSRELSRYHDKRVLYLNFEEIPATELYLKNNKENRNIGDFLYFLFEKNNVNLCSHPEGFTSHDEFGVETFYPTKGRNDLNHLTQEELICFLKLISDSCRYDYITMDLRNDLSEETLFLLNQCGRIILIQNDDPVSKYKNSKFLAYLSERTTFNFKDRIILAINKVYGLESEMDNSKDFNLYHSKSITIEKDDNSFRYTLSHLDIDLNHAFGIGIKKIADEILSTERKENTKCMENFAQ
ncbi:MAG TPA: hypothetical protein VEA58_12205 [Anaerovoracaceae bacterium]|nr:hypothetical protein [Anaerovoracaceae bacterium]